MVEIIVVKRNRIVSCRIGEQRLNMELQNGSYSYSYSYIYGGNMIGIKKNGMDNESVGIEKGFE